MPVKILLADKSITIQKVVEMLFSGKEYEVVSMSDGESALAEARRAVPGVVLADVDLPRIDGYSLAAQLKTVPELADTPVILMMSRDDVYDENRGSEAGIFDSIVKPFESQELIGKVQKALATAPPPASPVEAPKLQPHPPVQTEAPRPKTAPADIFDIISEAPTQAELAQTAAPDKEEVVFEVEPVVEEVEEPQGGGEELDKGLPLGAQAVEETSAGLGISVEGQEPQTEPGPEAVAPQAGLGQPVQAPMLSQEKLRKIAEEVIAKTAREIFKDMTPAAPDIAEETVRRGIADSVSPIVREIAREIIEKVAWEVVPDLAEQLIRAEIERLKADT